MSQLTSVVRNNTSIALFKINKAIQSLNAEGANTSAQFALRDARNTITETIGLLVPPTTYPRAVRSLNAALSIVTDYTNYYFRASPSIVTSIPPVSAINSIIADDHAAAHALVAVSLATHTAIADGMWSSAVNWSPAAVPPAGARVYISAARTITYDVNAATSLKTVHADGVLRFHKTKNTRMVIDFMFVGGELGINTSSAFKTSIEFAGGAIDTGWDPRLISRGLVAHGKVSIYGSFKTPFRGMTDTVSVNAKTVRLASAATGWVAGDKISFAPTRMNPLFRTWTPSVNFTDSDKPSGLTEIKSITGINAGVSITIDTSTAYNYRLPTNALRPNTRRMTRSSYAANLTRNVVFRTLGNVSVHRRGHIMFMANNTAVKNTKFKALGRTNKEVFSSDITAVQNAGVSVSSRLNIQGRYPIHLHNSGLTGGPALIEYNVVSGTEGWGIAHHNGYAHINGNVVYKAYGAGIVAEIGNEIGKWNNNLVFDMTSRKRDITKNFVGFDRFGQGIAYAFAARNLSVSGNVAAGFVNAGYSWLMRGNLLTTPASVLHIPEMSRYTPFLTADDIPIKYFRNNRAQVGKIGVEVVKAEPFQEHNIRSYLVSILAFEVMAGMEITYTGHYTVKDCELIGKSNPGPFQQKFQGFITTQSADMVVTSTRLRDWRWGYLFDLRTVGNPAADQWSTTNNEFLVVEQSLVSVQTTIIGTAQSTTLFRRYSQLPNTPLSIVFDSSITSREVSTANQAFQLRHFGTFIDSTGNRRFPIGYKADGIYATWTRGVGNPLKYIAGNFGHFIVSGKFYLVTREPLQDRVHLTSTNRNSFIRLKSNPATMFSCSSKLLGTFTTKSQVSVPAWSGRTPITSF